MKAEQLVKITGVDFFVGVPDSQLKGLCDYLMDVYGIDPGHHLIAANEGSAVGIAAGYHLATGKVPLVYMQNSGEGNIINPVASLLHEKVYAIPCIFVIGWRGEPGVHDEPQHIFQGEITLKLLADMGIVYAVIDRDTSGEMLCEVMEGFRCLLRQGKSVAFVVRKGALTCDKRVTYQNDYAMRREEIIRRIIKVSDSDPVVSTTGKTSRELFELREETGQGHSHDFLTVGSMGHSSSIALGVALNRPGKKVWCVDGDGAALMHMGALAVIGQSAPENLVHVVINNGAHESVGGMPTVARGVDMGKIAEGCGYRHVFCVAEEGELERVLKMAKERAGLTFIEVRTAVGAREDLGRPTTAPAENKEAFMTWLREID